MNLALPLADRTRVARQNRARRNSFSTSLVTALLLISLIAPASSATNAARPTAQDSVNASSQAQSKTKRIEFKAGEILVRFRSQNDSTADVTSRIPAAVALRAPNETGGRELAATIERFDGSEIVKGLRLARLTNSNDSEDTLRAVAALNARSDVLYAEPNFIRHADAVPNDTRYGEEWGLKNTGQPINGGAGGVAGADIKAEQAWDITKGSRSVVVGVIDEGVDVSHPDLKDNIWTNPAPGSLPGFANDVNGYDFVNNSGSIPANNHATHVAGIIGATGNNGMGVTGVNWQVSIMSLKVLQTGADPTPNQGGTDATIIRAYSYAKQMRDLWTSTGGAKGANIRVLNNSYGGTGFSQSSLDAIKALGDSGILFIAAAGNDGSDNYGAPHFPSDYDAQNVINVAATTRSDTLASYSSFGERVVQLAAPGDIVLSAFPNNSYSYLSGTSMATPHVAGSAALVCAAYPNISLQKLRGALIYSGDYLTSLNNRTITSRRLNVYNALLSAGENDATPPAPAGDFRITSVSSSGRTLTISWLAPGDDGNTGRASNYELSLIDSSNGRAIRESVNVSGILPAGAGTRQTATVTLPLRFFSGTLALKTFDKVGNSSVATIPVSVAQNAATDPYVYSLSANAPLSTGGTALNLKGDDSYSSPYQLPFTFPFYNQNRTSVILSTNGGLYFSSPPRRSNGDADDAGQSPDFLNGQAMIAPLLEDLRTDRNPTDDVYVVQPNADSVIFRWQAVTFGDNPDGTTRGENPCNFEVELRRDGTILMRYGAGNAKVRPVVGVGLGEPQGYVVNELTSYLALRDLTNAQTVTFAPRSSSFATPTLQFETTNYNVSEAVGSVTLNVTRTGDASGAVSVDYATVDGAAHATSDYNVASGTLKFAAGETRKSVSVFINDDGKVNGARSFNVVLSNPAGGATLAQNASVAVVNIADNDSAPAAANPIDATNFFVRQQYIDFLNREPDPSGFQFWTNEINSCNGNAACIDAKRQSVSAAYFLSVEFQQTGYLVYRFYKAAYGRVPRLAEFTPDTQAIGQGVVVTPDNSNGYLAVLEANKQAYANSFVTRPQFVLQFPASLSNAAYVDALNQNTGGALTTDQRNALVSGLQNGAETRATVLRKVAENQTFTNAEFNRAFVLMQYFGYLRRNPDDAPDGNLNGYNFWLNKLNSFGGDYIKSEMIRSFIVSQEYRQRFGGS